MGIHPAGEAHLEQEALGEAVQAGALGRYRRVMGFALPGVGQQRAPLQQRYAVLKRRVLKGAQGHLQLRSGPLEGYVVL